VIAVTMDIVVYLIKKGVPELTEIKQIGDNIIKREKHFSTRQVVDWLPWLKMIVNGDERPKAVFLMDPEKSIEVDISQDGVQCKTHRIISGLSTCVANNCVKTGKWYYEVTMITAGLLQIGWVTEDHESDPDCGMGVGDDNYSWAVDLFRNRVWYNSFSDSYAMNTKWHPNGTLQCYLDLDNSIMSFGYDGEALGVAFTDFEVGNGLYPAFSASHGEEIRFNFGEQPFKYPPKGFNPLNLLNQPEKIQQKNKEFALYLLEIVNNNSLNE